jgi:hypothetical protein
MSAADSVVANMNPEERDALVDRLKGELQAKTEESAQLKARAELCAQFEEKERIRLGAFQSECASFVDTLMEDGDADTNADLGPLKKWADGYLQNPDIVKQAPLARGFFVASAKLKRARDEASVGAKAGETLANTLKELEGVKDQLAKKEQRTQELETLCDERQKQAEKLTAELAKHGLMSEKYNFSKASSREAEDDATKKEETNEQDVGSIVSNTAANVLEQVTSNASKMAVAARDANPLDDLTSFITTRGRGGSRMMASGTQHAFLGAQNDVDLLSTLRGM